MKTNTRTYQPIDSQTYALDPSSPEHWSHLLNTLRESGQEPHAWIHLAGLDLATASAPPATRSAARNSCAALRVAGGAEAVARSRPAR